MADDKNPLDAAGAPAPTTAERPTPPPMQRLTKVDLGYDSSHRDDWVAASNKHSSSDEAE